MTRVDPPQLTEFATAALQAKGVPEGDARIVATSLVEADLGDQGSHGVMRLPFLLRRLQAGLINPHPQMRVQPVRPGTALLDADNALGPVAGTRAVDLAVERARECGVGVVAVRRSNHLGSLSFYVRRLTTAGMAGLGFSNTPPAMAPPRASTPFLGTNPIAAGFPRSAGQALVVDLATSQVARGRILKARQNGERLPEGWAVDASGRPTIDPEAAIAGSLAPLGGAKGFALALMVEVMTGVLAGAGVGPAVTGTFSPSDRESDVGHSFWALDVDAFGPGFGERLERLVADLRDVDGRIPGERYGWVRERRLREGIQVPDELAAELEGLTGARVNG